MKNPKAVALLCCILGTVAICAAYAGGNPLIHECENYGGIFTLLAPGQQQDLPMCSFGPASIGALDLVNYRAGCSDDAATAFLSSQASNLSSVCTQSGAQEMTGQSAGGEAYDLCSFTDGSMIDVHTLALGAQAPENRGLLAALAASSEGPVDPSECSNP